MKTTDTWRSALLRRTTDLSPTVREFELVPEHGPVPSYAPGSHIDLRVLVGEPGRGARQEVRSYSLVGAPRGDALRIAVKRLDAGRGGSRYLWSLQPGARLTISAPANHFPLDHRAPQVLLVAGGIGITPLVGMAQALCALGADVRLVYAARSAAELVYLDTLREAFGPRVDEHLRLRLSDQGEFVDFAGEIAALAPAAQLVMCGPAPMMDAARAAWAASGRPRADLRFETFGSSGHHAVQPFVVELPRHGREITVPADRSLLDVLEEAGIEVVADCRRGECGLCVLDVLGCQGTIDHRDVFLGEHEKARGDRVCTCVSRVAGPGARLVIDTAWRPDA